MSLSSFSSASAFFDGLLGDVERGALRQPQLQEQFGPLRQREELLLHVAEADDGQREDADRRQHHLDAVVDAPLDHAAQDPVDAGLVDRVRIVVVAARVMLGSSLTPI